MERYAASTVNVSLAAVNGFLERFGWVECKVHPLRVQRNAYREAQRNITGKEYRCLLSQAKKQRNMRLYYLLQTLCSTGIRISELRFITVKAVECGRAEVRNKGKTRLILLPTRLCAMLRQYCCEEGIAAGSVFVTRNGRPMDRANIWTMMKRLAHDAKIQACKVYPHNLRHLFAQTFYSHQHDLDHLAVLLGHSSIDTTRIYTRSAIGDYRSQIEALCLVQ